ncbi:pseudouridine synthase [Neptunomonas qingdaonensis]|uniref:Pseudouridine synthase n=1 Tax=Neptunomonas qingdaonensis TaxID=1045558 RepID=A0A1I2UGW1_9GAMM|nr:16S rRNA pseudouridine(516) synthase [Neptunomonas qingdaonensis]SFG76278.1 16S rRNA pseudouridine516 synthase [Neptunomonas qingdaonensis]
MQSKRARLDRFLSSYLQINRKDVRLMLAHNRVTVDGVVAKNIDQLVDEFSRIVLDDRVLQTNSRVYLMMHKPVGVVSATKDEQHRTVIDLLDNRVDKNALHIVGRLDLNSSGLLLLTNDGRWSRQLTSPQNKVTKVYQVTLQNPLSQEYIAAFEEGMYFAYENITTQPAKLQILSEFVAQVSLTEGRYHQIKRMFGRFRNPVLHLHRTAIGALSLDPGLAPGQSRELTAYESTHINMPIEHKLTADDG